LGLGGGGDLILMGISAYLSVSTKRGCCWHNVGLPRLSWAIRSHTS
jgi:hypothetical protein